MRERQERIKRLQAKIEKMKRKQLREELKKAQKKTPKEGANATYDE